MYWRPDAVWQWELGNRSNGSGEPTRSGQHSRRRGPAGWRGQLLGFALVVGLVATGLGVVNVAPWLTKLHAFGADYVRFEACCEYAFNWSRYPITLVQVRIYVPNPVVVHLAGFPRGWLGFTTTDDPPSDPPLMIFLQSGDDAYVPYALDRLSVRTEQPTLAHPLASAGRVTFT